MTQNYTTKKHKNNHEITPSKAAVDFILNFSKSYKVLKGKSSKKPIEFYSN
tara:strand:- start:1303 stop:1455 length:153 start_codon:yes stop_codon:yes gene_type:complete